MAEFSSSYILQLKDEFSRNARAMADSAKVLSASLKDLSKSASEAVTAMKALRRSPMRSTTSSLKSMSTEYARAARNANSFAVSQARVARSMRASGAGMGGGGGGGGGIGGAGRGARNGWYSEVARMFGFRALANASLQTSQQILRLGASIIDVSSDIEQSFVQVRKAYDFKSIGESDATKQQALKFASSSTMSIPDIMAIIAGGLKAGESLSAVKELLPIIERGAVAFDVGGQEMSSIVFTAKSLYKLNKDGMVNLLDVVNQLDKDNKSTASVTMKMLSGKMGGVASSTGMSATSAAGWAAAMQDKNIGMSEGQNLFSALASRMSGSFAGGDKGYALIKNSLGIDMLDYTRTMKKEGVEAAIFKALEDMNRLISEKKDHGVAASVFTTKLIGQHYAGDLKKLASQLEGKNGVRDIVMRAKASGYGGGSARREYTEQSATYAAQLQKFTNQIQTMMYEIGVVLLPVLVEIMEDMRPHLESMTDWIRNNKPLVKEIVKLLVVAVPVLTAMYFVLNMLAAGAQIAAADLVGAGVVLKGLSVPALLTMAALQGVLNIFKEMEGTNYMDSLFRGMQSQMSELNAYYNSYIKPNLDLVVASINLIIDLTLAAVLTTIAALRMAITQVMSLLPKDTQDRFNTGMFGDPKELKGMTDMVTGMSHGVRKYNANLAHYIPTGEWYDNKNTSDMTEDIKKKLETAQVKKNLEEGSKSAGKAFTQLVYGAGSDFARMVASSKLEVSVSGGGGANASVSASKKTNPYGDYDSGNVGVNLLMGQWGFSGYRNK
jgi:TP901 family phage tail tape measure protein